METTIRQETIDAIQKTNIIATETLEKLWDNLQNKDDFYEWVGSSIGHFRDSTEFAKHQLTANNNFVSMTTEWKAFGKQLINSGAYIVVDNHYFENNGLHILEMATANIIDNIYTHRCEICDDKITREKYDWTGLCSVCENDIYDDGDSYYKDQIYENDESYEC